MWTPTSPDFEALVKQVLNLKADLEEYKTRLDYLEEALLLPEERAQLKLINQRVRERREASVSHLRHE